MVGDCMNNDNKSFVTGGPTPLHDRGPDFQLGTYMILCDKSITPIIKAITPQPYTIIEYDRAQK